MKICCLLIIKTTLYVTNEEKQESQFVFPQASWALFCSGDLGALVMPVEDECNLHGDSIKHFLLDSKRLGSILNVYVLHLLLQKKNLYIYIYINKLKKNPSGVSSVFSFILAGA